MNWKYAVHAMHLSACTQHAAPEISTVHFDETILSQPMMALAAVPFLHGCGFPKQPSRKNYGAKCSRSRIILMLPPHFSSRWLRGKRAGLPDFNRDDENNFHAWKSINYLIRFTFLRLASRFFPGSCFQDHFSILLTKYRRFSAVSHGESALIKGK